MKTSTNLITSAAVSLHRHSGAIVDLSAVRSFPHYQLSLLMGACFLIYLVCFQLSTLYKQINVRFDIDRAQLLFHARIRTKA